MTEIDKTKENIGVDKLDQSTRKKLFNKFVDAGGEIVSERSKRRSLIIDREKQQVYKDRLDEHNKKARSATPYSERNRMGANGKPGTGLLSSRSPVIESHFSAFINRLKIRLHLRLLKVSRFNGVYFHPKFLERFNNTYKSALMEIQVIYLDIFKKNLTNGARITQRLDRIKPLYFEVIEMIGNIYDKMTTDQIVEHYINFPDVPKNVSELKDPLMEIYRRLHLVKLYENSILNGFIKALELQEMVENKKAQGLSARRRKVKHSLNVLFHKLYPRLHWLLCLYEGHFIQFDSQEIDDIFSISDAEKPGNRIFNKPGYDDTAMGDDEESVIDSDDRQKDEKKSIPDNVKRGLQLMYSLNLQELRNVYDKKGLFEHISDNDKVLVTFLLFSEFDSEYSFLLTTNKIKFNVEFTADGKFNYGTRLQQLYDDMRKPTDSLRDYAAIFANYEKIRNEKPSSNTQYIAYSKRLQDILKKRDQSGKMARMVVRAYMEKLTEELKPLIEDMNTIQKFVLNPQDGLMLDDNIEGKKKLHGKKVYEAIQAMFNYASAFVNRLAQGGDLSGSIEYKEGEQESALKSMGAEKVSEQNLEENLDTLDPSKSIFDELDDML